jgi:hypothetical protein
MLRDDIRAMLFLSPSGINKYIRLLREEGVVELDRYIAPSRLSLGHPLYRLASDTEQVERYLRSLDGPREVRTKPAPATRPHDPSSRIYRMEDDGKFKCPAPQWPIPAPDPVLAAFFGMTKSEPDACSA